VATALGKTVLVLFPIFIGAFAGIYFSFTTDIWPRVFGFIICTVWAIAIIAIAVRAAGRAEWRRCLGVDSRFACHFARELRAGFSGWRLHSFSDDVADLSVNHTD
jgi:hypothetical protein